MTKGPWLAVLGDRKVKVIDVAWRGSSAITLTYIDDLTGRADQELLDEPCSRPFEVGTERWTQGHGKVVGTRSRPVIRT